MMQSLPPNEQSAFVSSKPAERREARYALAAVLVSIAIFSIAAPFATLPLAQVPVFIPAYEAALVISGVNCFKGHSKFSDRGILAVGYAGLAAIKAAALVRES